MTRCWPLCDSGTSNVAVKVPTLSVKAVPICMSSKVRVKVSLAANPMPVIFTLVPMGPVDGPTDMLGITVNREVSVTFVVRSRTVILCVPLALDGTENA